MYRLEVEEMIIRKAGQAIWKKVCFMVDLINDGMIRIGRISSCKYTDNLIYIVHVRVDNLNHGMVDQLGVYYDMRYWRYHKRLKFLAGLSSYNDDEIVEQIEREEIERTKERRKELEEFNIEKEFVTENTSRLLLEWYPGLSIRELAVCNMIIWTEWDMGTPFYFELIPRIICHYMKLFFSLKHIQDTIQGLIHKGIITPMICRNGENESSYIYLILNQELEEQAFKLISGDSNETSVA